MAQDQYGAAQPIVDVFKNAYDKTESFFDKVPSKKSEPNDTIKRLNEKSEEDQRKEVYNSFLPKTEKKGTTLKGSSSSYGKSSSQKRKSRKPAYGK